MPTPNPRKRTDIQELSDKVYALKSAIVFKLSIESQIKTQTKLVSTMLKPSLLRMLFMIFSYRLWKESSLKRKLEITKLRADNQVKEKLKHTYHRNELQLEDFFETIYEEMAERFDAYYYRLKFLFNNLESCPEAPQEDIKVLVQKYEKSPPKDKTDKMSFYLSMESTLYRCINV